ncbi:hypothetical protein LguiB_008058 [Lonicera macranthoides]
MASEIETLEEEKEQADSTTVEEKLGEAKEDDDDDKDKQLVSSKKDEENVEEEQEREEEEEDTIMADKEGSQKGEEETQDESTESKGAAKESTTEEKAKSGSRPTRERKIVERYTESSAGRGSATKPLSIDKGRGTQLKDIPNVAFKLSKRKPDDNLQILHNILFGKRTKVHNLKKNIGMFSGYLWVENEQEKQRAKVKEKLDKCVKEKLLDFCDVLNIPINKATIKKEDLSTKLLEFLESPHTTTDNLLSDKEKKSNKRKGKVTGSVHAVSETAAKKQKNSPVGEKRKRSLKIEEEDKVEPLGNEDDSRDEDEIPVVESYQEERKSEPEEEESKNQKPSERNSSKKNVKKDSMVNTADNSKSIEEDSPTISTKTPPESTKNSSKKNKVEEESKKDQNLEAKEKASRKKQSSTKKPKVEEESEKDQNLSAKEKTSSKKQSSTKENKVYESEKDKSLSAKEKASTKKQSCTKKNKVEEESEKDKSLSAKEKTSSKKQSSSSSMKVSAKDQEKGKAGKKAKEEPSREQMHAVAVDILKEVDFNTATLSDIVKQLGTHFGVDLTNRKAEVKAIIAEVISNMTDDDEEEESDGEDENKAAA